MGILTCASTFWATLIGMGLEGHESDPTYDFKRAANYLRANVRTLDELLESRSGRLSEEEQQLIDEFREKINEPYAV